MGSSARIWQVESEGGPAWKEPAGPKVDDDFPEDWLDEHGKLDLDKDWQLIGQVLEQLSIKVPWDEDDALEPKGVQALATKLKKYDWLAVKTAGVEVEDELEDRWLEFRHLVIDAARACNGLEWEID
jgi:hypothetical protein